MRSHIQVLINKMLNGKAGESDVRQSNDRLAAEQGRGFGRISGVPDESGKAFASIQFLFPGGVP